MPAARDPYAALDPESEEHKEMRAQGLVPVVLWLPDTSDPEFIAEARRRAQEIADCPDCGQTRERAMHPELVRTPDPSSPHFAEEMRRQAKAINESPHADEDMDFIESVSILLEE